MGIKRLVVSLALLFIVAPASAAHAQRVALLPVSGTNLHEGYLQATQDFLRGHLEATGRFQVITVPGPPRAQEVDAGEAVTRAREVGADIAVVCHVARLGATARIRLVAYDARSGQMIHTDTMSAGSPDDIDPALARLARGLAEGKPASETADIHTVTEKEADPLLKQQATSVFGVRIGVVSPVTRAEDGSAGLPGMGVFWLYDVRTFLADVSIDFHSKDGEGDFTVALGAYYPFSQRNTTFYAGGGLRYGTSDYGDDVDGGSGVSFFASGGVLLGRLSTVQLRGEASYFVNMFEETSADKNESARGSGLILSVGIGF